MPAETHVEPRADRPRRGVRDGARVDLAEILEIDEDAHHARLELRRRPRRRLARAHRAGRGARGGAGRAHRRLQRRRRGPRRPAHGPRRRSTTSSHGLGATAGRGRGRMDARRPGFERDRLVRSATRARSSRRCRTAPTAPSTPSVVSNERLEFLGDAVLGIVVTDHVFRDYPAAPRGRAREGARVRGERRGARRGRGRRSSSAPALLLGKGEDASGGARSRRSSPTRWRRSSPRSTSTAGWEAARRVVLAARRRPHRRRRPPARRPRLQDAGSRSSRRDASTSCRGTRCATKVRTTRSGSSRRCSLGGEARGDGEGRSKKQAEQAARATAWELAAEPRPGRRASTTVSGIGGSRMPELPEVEVVRRDLETEIVGKRSRRSRSTGMRSVRRHRQRKQFIGRARGQEDHRRRAARQVPARAASTAATCSSCTSACPASCCARRAARETDARSTRTW